MSASVAAAIRAELERQQDTDDLYLGEYSPEYWVVDGHIDVTALAAAIAVPVDPVALLAVLQRHREVRVTAGQRPGETENVMVGGYQCACGLAVFPQRDDDGKPVEGTWYLEHLRDAIINFGALSRPAPERPKPDQRRGYGSRFD